LFTLAGAHHFYTDFWELDAASDISCETIVELTEGHFAHYGIPQKVITDNGPQFRTQLYKDFAKQWGCNHVTSSPYHSQSNGKAESAVKIAKGMLKKVTKDNRDINCHGVTHQQQEDIIAQSKNCIHGERAHNYQQLMNS